jgi:hypothetical protein
MKFEQDILFEFLPEEDKRSFMVWDNAFLNVSRDTIVAIYRAPFEERVFIPLDEYQLRVKEKERDNKLNNLGIC